MRVAPTRGSQRSPVLAGSSSRDEPRPTLSTYYCAHFSRVPFVHALSRTPLMASASPGRTSDRVRPSRMVARGFGRELPASESLPTHGNGSACNASANMPDDALFASLQPGTPVATRGDVASPPLPDTVRQQPATLPRAARQAHQEPIGSLGSDGVHVGRHPSLHVASDSGAPSALQTAPPRADLRRGLLRGPTLLRDGRDAAWPPRAATPTAPHPTPRMAAATAFTA